MQIYMLHHSAEANNASSQRTEHNLYTAFDPYHGPPYSSQAVSAHAACCCVQRYIRHQLLQNHNMCDPRHCQHPAVMHWRPKMRFDSLYEMYQEHCHCQRHVMEHAGASTLLLSCRQQFSCRPVSCATGLLDRLPCNRTTRAEVVAHSRAPPHKPQGRMARRFRTRTSQHALRTMT